MCSVRGLAGRCQGAAAEKPRGRLRVMAAGLLSPGPSAWGAAGRLGREAGSAGA